MAHVDDSLIAQARNALGVTEVAVLKPGAQKAVRLVERGSDRLVMKVIAVGTTAPEALKRAEREVTLLASLNSPHVVKVESALAELGSPVAGAAWLEEHLDGVDLSAELGPAWDWDEVAKLGLHVGRGLAAGHANGVVHRDLSPNNVRHLADGSYKVMDFGFARHTLLSGITVAGQPGTPGYASPEHLNSYSGGPNAASDVFCTGILMYQALTGQQPIPYRGDDADYVGKLQAPKVADLRTLRPDLTAEQGALVMRCLHPQPARRFLDGGRLASAIEAL